MKINRKLRSGDVKIDEYLTELEDALLHKETSAIEQFIRASNKIAKTFAEDMELLADGQIDKCKLLSPESSDKTVERIILMLKNSELFSHIANAADKLAPEIVNEVADLKIQIGEDENPFEKIQQRVKTNGRG